jgi:hypothetical protein
MKNKKRIITTVILIISAAIGTAGTTGKITGVVIDSDDKQPVVGTRVVIDRTTMGAMVNAMDGRYFIMKVPPGKYRLTASCIGYKLLRSDSIEVHAGDSLSIDFTLKSEPMRTEHINLYDGPPLLNRYETNLIIHIHERQLEALPTDNLTGILKLKAGIVDSDGSLHIRGSRGDEVAIIDDGVLIRDQLGGH